MSTKLKVTLVTVVVAIVTAVLGPIIWTPANGEGPGALLPYFIVVSLLESIAFGLGVSFLVFGWSWVRRATRETGAAARILYVSIAWSMMSWWPHDNMHISNAHDNWGRLLMIEWLFHVTLILAAIGMAWSFFQVMKKNQALPA